MRRPCVLVADPLLILRTGVRSLLARESVFEVAEAASLAEVVAVAGERLPDIALIDLTLPPAGGIAAVEWLARNTPTLPIVWSFEPAPDTVLAAVRAGARGFLRKETSLHEFVRALQGVVHGEAPLSRDLVALMIDAIHGSERRVEARTRAAALTVRERQVLDLVSDGARNRDIAAALAISEFTVKRHVQNILTKLELSSRRAAASFYRTASAPDEPLTAARVT